MEAPVLSKKQIKSSLSVKKTKLKEVVKNVLSSPYENAFWPQLSPQDQDKMKSVLEKYLPRMKPVKFNVPWKEVKSIPKQDRKKFRKEFAQKLNSFSSTEKAVGLILGINDVTKGLEQNFVSSVLISDDIQPRIMVQHVIDQCVNGCIPVLIVANLRKMTKRNCGVCSAVLGIAKNIDDNGKLSRIDKCIKEVFQNVPTLKNHINLDRSQKAINTSEQILENAPDEKCQQISLHERISKETVYLKTDPNTKGRVFIPHPRKKPIASDTVPMDIDFIAFSDKSEKSETKKCSYKSLKVKRFKNDLLRSKKKMKTLKRRT